MLENIIHSAPLYSIVPHAVLSTHLLLQLSNLPLLTLSGFVERQIQDDPVSVPPRLQHPTEGGDPHTGAGVVADSEQRGGGGQGGVATQGNLRMGIGQWACGAHVMDLTSLVGVNQRRPKSVPV